MQRDKKKKQTNSLLVTILSFNTNYGSQAIRIVFQEFQGLYFQ